MLLYETYLAIPPWLLCGFLFVLGSVIGSFLNVVVYRLPRQISLSYPGSRCPSCNEPIRWYHNIPVLGWLMLGGRCADCGARISIRYPIVEAMVGTLFVLVALADLTYYSIPLADGTTLAGIDLLDGLPYARDLVLLCMLLVCAWIEFDGQAPPRQLMGWCAVLMFLTWVAALGYWGIGFRTILASTLLPNVVIGLLCGLPLGYMLTWPAVMAGRKPLAGAMQVSVILMAIVLGWRGAVVSVTVIAVVQLVESLASLFARRRVRLGTFSWLFLTALAWVLFTEGLNRLTFSWADWIFLVAALLVPIWCLLTGLVEIQYQHERPPAGANDPRELATGRRKVSNPG